MVREIKEEGTAKSKTADLWKRAVKRFDLAEDRKRKNMVSRVAYVDVVLSRKIMTTMELGWVLGRDHSAVVYMRSVANNGTYDDLVEYSDMRKWFSQRVRSITSEYKESTETTIAGRYDDMLEENKRLVDIINRNSHELLDSVKELTELERQVHLINAKVKPVGYKPVDVSHIENIRRTVLKIRDRK